MKITSTKDVFHPITITCVIETLVDRNIFENMLEAASCNIDDRSAVAGLVEKFYASLPEPD